MTKLTDSVYAVEVPEGAFTWDVLTVDDKQYLAGDDDHGNMEIGTQPLPPGPWRILCTTREATEEQAHQIVESVTTANELPVYRDYEFSQWMKTAVGSLRSLITSKGLDGNKNYVLLKKIR